MNIRKNAGIVTMIAGAAIALSACQSSPEPRERAQPMTQLPMNQEIRPVTQPIDRIGGPVDTLPGAILIHKQRLEAKRNGAERVGAAVIDHVPDETMRVKYTARDAAADEVLRVLVREFLDRSYVFHAPPAARAGAQTITLDVDQEMTKQDVYDLVGALAALYGWSIDDRGDMLVIGQASSMSRTSTAPILEARAALGSDETALRVFRLRYMGAKECSDAISELISEGAKTVVSGRTLMVVDRMRQLNRIGRIIESLDMPAFHGAEIWTYELTYEKASDAVAALTRIGQSSRLIGGTGAGMTESLVSFVEIAGTNRIMVISREPSAQNIVRRWVESIDQPRREARRQKHIYRFQNLEPGRVLALLNSVFSERVELSNKDAAETGIRFTVEQDEGVLVIYATPYDFAEVYSFLERMDVARQQVVIQSIIAEVTLRDSLQYGVEYFLQVGLDSSLLDLTGNLTQLGPSSPTGTIAFIATDGFAVVQALDQRSDVSVLSTPKLFVRDKDQASFQFGAEVPILRASLDSATQTGGTTGIRNEVEYRETGVILTYQPRINENGDVTIVIRQEITDAVPNVTSGIDSPTFTKREVETTVTIPHGHTLLLAGIIEQRETDRVGKIPLLGDIPIFGHAFRNVDKTNERTELLLTITPTVINEAREAGPILDDFLISARGVENALAHFKGRLPEALIRGVGVNDAGNAGATPNAWSGAPVAIGGRPVRNIATEKTEADSAPQGETHAVTPAPTPVSAPEPAATPVEPPPVSAGSEEPDTAPAIAPMIAPPSPAMPALPEPLIGFDRIARAMSAREVQEDIQVAMFLRDLLSSVHGDGGSDFR